MSAPTAPHTTATEGDFHAVVDLSSEAATAAFAEQMAPLLGKGDVLLLSGPIGAGKTTFARALIARRLALAGAPAEDIPSPTFTLVQTYLAGPLEIWHADLYRLSHPDEVAELGLQEAFDTALCLVEWPDRLGDDLPLYALKLHFAPMEGVLETRRLTLTGPQDWRLRIASLPGVVDV